MARAQVATLGLEVARALAAGSALMIAMLGLEVVLVRVAGLVQVKSSAGPNVFRAPVRAPNVCATAAELL